MATNPMKTLFGDTEDTLLRQMRMEDQDRVNQARILDKQSGGNYYSGLIADAAQQQANVFSNLLPKGVRAVGGLLGQEEGANKIAAGMEDPRLRKARKRKADLDMLSKKYETLGSDKDGFTNKDAKTIVDDLMSLGYLEEAKKMADIWQGRRKLDIEESLVPIKKKKAEAALKSALRGNRRYKSTGAAVYLREENGKTYAVMQILDEVTNKIITKEVEMREGELLGDKFRTTIEKIGKEHDVAEAKETGKNWATKRELILDNMRSARDVGINLNKVVAALESGEKTGGLYEIADDVKNYFGISNPRFAEIKQRLTDTILAKLKETGTKPTDADLRFIRGRMADVTKGNKNNIAILKSILSKVNRVVRRGELVLDNKFDTQEDFEKAVQNQTLDELIATTIPEGAKDRLLSNPKKYRDDFDKQYGVGTARRIIEKKRI